MQQDDHLADVVRHLCEPGDVVDGRAALRDRWERVEVGEQLDRADRPCQCRHVEPCDASWEHVRTRVAEVPEVDELLGILLRRVAEEVHLVPGVVVGDVGRDAVVVLHRVDGDRRLLPGGRSQSCRGEHPRVERRDHRRIAQPGDRSGRHQRPEDGRHLRRRVDRDSVERQPPGTVECDLARAEQLGLDLRQPRFVERLGRSRHVQALELGLHRVRGILRPRIADLDLFSHGRGRRTRITHQGDQVHRPLVDRVQGLDDAGEAVEHGVLRDRLDAVLHHRLALDFAGDFVLLQDRDTVLVAEDHQEVCEEITGVGTTSPVRWSCADDRVATDHHQRRQGGDRAAGTPGPTHDSSFTEDPPWCVLPNRWNAGCVSGGVERHLRHRRCRRSSVPRATSYG